MKENEEFEIRVSIEESIKISKSNGGFKIELTHDWINLDKDEAITLARLILESEEEG